MAILNRITVGFKQILEVDADPSVSGVSAPIGSEAFFDDAGVGKSYLKFGSGDTQWASYQTGAEPSDWKFTTDANQLNVATAKAYFGTKTGSDYDIEFQRNGLPRITLTSTDIVLHKDILFSDSFQGAIKNTVGSIAIQAGGDIAMLGNNFALSTNTNKFYKNYITGSGTDFDSYVPYSISNPSVTHEAVYTMFGGLTKFIKVTITYQASNGDNMVLEKTIHVDSSNNIVLIQDDFTSKSSNLSGLLCSVTVLGNDLKFNFSGIPTGLGKKLALFVNQKSRN